MDGQPSMFAPVKSGSAASPSILSPQAVEPPECELSREEGILGATLPDSLYAPVPLQKVPAAPPLFSPPCSSSLTSPLDTANETTISFISALSPTNRTHISPTHPSLSMSRRNHNLRLPPFDSLGIAAPHPDKISSRLDCGLIDAAKEHTPDSRCLEHPTASYDGTKDIAGCRICEPVFGHQPLPSAGPGFSPPNLNLLTPPAEQIEHVLFSQSSAIDSPETLAGQTEHANTTPFSESEQANAAIDDRSAAAVFPGTNQTDWTNVVATQIQSTTDADYLDDPIKVLSHALPTPSVPGHRFPDIINALKSQFSPSRLAWINLLHAVPGRFNMSEFPTSPPSTPGLAIGEDDYFTTQVFESFAFLANDDERPKPAPAFAQSTAAAPPSSIHLAIVERYIPPGSQREFASLFNPLGPSFLVDRLIELSPKQGCLVFVYPTQKGAATFIQDYLAPVLDPLLRSMAVRHEFSSALSKSIGEMTSVNHLLEFESMQAQIARLCSELGDSSQANRGRPAFRSKFTPIYSGAHKVALSGDVWSQWWIKQEKRRIRSVIAEYFGRTLQRRSLDSRDSLERVPMNIVQEVLDGVSMKSTNPSQAEASLEVGVFVIRRDSSTRRLS